jgi:hypothetical protein
MLSHSIAKQTFLGGDYVTIDSQTPRRIARVYSNWLVNFMISCRKRCLDVIGIPKHAATRSLQLLLS